MKQAPAARAWRSTAAGLKAIRDKLDSAADIVTVGRELGLIVEAAEESHIRDHWFDENGGGWFKAVPNVKARVRDDFREVVRLLRQNPRPLDLFLQVLPNPLGGGFSFEHLMVPGRLVVVLTVPQPTLPPGTTVTVEGDDLVLITAQFGDIIETRVAQVAIGLAATPQPAAP